MRTFMVLSAVVAVALADAESKPEAEADADLGHHGAPHHAPHHPAPYAPAPYAPAPYAPAPYAPAPYAPAYTPAPAYGYTPVYGHEGPNYTPAPHYGAHAAPHHAPAPHHPAPHHPAPHHADPHHPAPHDAHYAPPKCAHNNPKPFCLEDPEYPTYEIQQAIEYNYDAVQQLYKDVLANTENSVDHLKDIIEETYLCPADTAYIQPFRAVNVHGKWRIVVNHVKAHYETLTQTARIEECSTPGSACPLVPECYETKCLQKSIYHRFLVYDAYDKYLPFAIESFKLPSSCACYNGAYHAPVHKK